MLSLPLSFLSQLTKSRALSVFRDFETGPLSMLDPDLLSGSAWLVPHLPNPAPGQGRAPGGTKPQDLTTLLLALTDWAERPGPSNPKCITGIQG